MEVTTLKFTAPFLRIWAFHQEGTSIKAFVELFAENWLDYHQEIQG
jgi:hypothetical protein